MSKRSIRGVSFLSAVLMLCGLGACKPAEKPSESAASSASAGPGTSSKEVVFGSHYIPTWDPTYTDPVTGDIAVSPEQMEVIEAATKAVKDQLGVTIKWVQWEHGVGEDLLPSVLSGNPICDVAMVSNASQGGLIEQGIIQNLEPYADIFTNDQDAAWMLMDPIFGKRLFLNFELSFLRTGPLLFNISYIEQVDALKENGQTVYPTDLYKQGKWTWSVFRDYLTKISAHFANKPAPIRPEKMINAFESDYRFSIRAAMLASGVPIYGENGFEKCTSPEAMKAVGFIKELVDKKLLFSELESDVYPGFTWADNNFANGEAVFLDARSWTAQGCGSKLASRGESMGLVPWPRPDDMAADDPRYQQVSTPNDSCILLKGVSAERSRLALEAYKLYFQTYYAKKSGGSASMDFFSDDNAEKEAIDQNLDIFHEKIGPDILDIFKNYGPMDFNDYSMMLSQMYGFTEIAGRSIYGDGSSFEVSIAENIGALNEAIGKIETAAKAIA